METEIYCDFYRAVLFTIKQSAVQFSIIWWLTDTSGGSPLILTLAGLAGFMPQALLYPFAGTITDRYSRKVIMIIADMTVALGSLALFVSMYFYDPSIILVIIVLIVRSLATAFHMPAMQASIPLIAPKEHLTKVSDGDRQWLLYQILLVQQRGCHY